MLFFSAVLSVPDYGISQSALGVFGVIVSVSGAVIAGALGLRFLQIAIQWLLRGGVGDHVPYRTRVRVAWWYVRSRYFRR